MKKTTKKNSTTRKLLPAFAMLAVSAVTLSTSTYAWFSMNKTVTVNGLNMTVTTDSTYLLINKVADNVQSDRLTTETSATNSSAAVLKPAAHNPKTGSAVTSGDLVTDTETANTVGNWYYKVANQPNSSASTGAANALTAFDGYVLHETYYVELATGSVDATNLRVSASTCTAAAQSKTNKAVKVLVTTSEGTSEQQYVTSGDPGETTWTTDTTQLAATVTANATTQVDVYVYYDGNDDSVYTENFANLDGATITLTFSVD